MTYAIAELIGEKLKTLSFVDHIGGLVEAGHFEFSDKPLIGKPTKSIKVVPVACRPTGDQIQCGIDAMVNVFIPDSEKRSVAFFVQTAGDTLLSQQGAKGVMLEYRFGMRFLIWVNGKRVIFTDGCNLSGALLPNIAALIYGRLQTTGASDFVKDNLFNINVDRVNALAKSPSNFGAFSFVEEGINRGLWLAPNDYAAIDISGTYQIRRNCLPQLNDYIQITDQC